jgi:hypothetical protein
MNEGNRGGRISVAYLSLPRLRQGFFLRVKKE